MERYKDLHRYRFIVRKGTIDIRSNNVDVWYSENLPKRNENSKIIINEKFRYTTKECKASSLKEALQKLWGDLVPYPPETFENFCKWKLFEYYNEDPHDWEAEQLIQYIDCASSWDKYSRKLVGIREDKTLIRVPEDIIHTVKEVGLKNVDYSDVALGLWRVGEKVKQLEKEYK